MGKEKCPTCGKSFQRLAQHKAMAHEGKTIGAAPGATSADGAFGGSIGKALSGSKTGVIADTGLTKSKPTLPSTRYLIDEDGQATLVLRGSGLRAVRKLGDTRRYEVGS